jgi:hypothetical protein
MTAQAIAAEANARWREKISDMRCFDGFQVESDVSSYYDPFTGIVDRETIYEATLYGGASYAGTESQVRAACRLHVMQRVKRH